MTMNKLFIAALVASAGVSSNALAQDTGQGTGQGTGSTQILGLELEPYIGIQAGYHEFDSDNRGPLTTNCNGASGCPDGGLAEAFAGANFAFGPGFVGVEGNI